MAILKKIDSWFEDNGRSLPWRGIDDPYRIWLSEIILQQTRIEQGRDYWLRFVEACPTVADLAAASEEQVLRLWQGLGYYSRARNLHAAAQYIMNECGGRFPSTYEGILKLKGVGRYTAAAIASFAFRLPYPVIDGNVYRFISRLYGIATPIGTDAAYTEFEQLLHKQIDHERPDRFNAALMDFGSLQCKPVPDCTGCPFVQDCEALRTGRVDMLPVKGAKRKPQDRWFYYLDVHWTDGTGDRGIMHRRDGKDIWKGLFEFPLMETERRLDDEEFVARASDFAGQMFGTAMVAVSVGEELVHQLTHRTIHARFLRVEIGEAPSKMVPDYIAMTLSEMKSVPVPRLIDRYLATL
ncbi:MAG: A/G-specific adenine glycosylase [Bacteroidales bacterium]|nr:A/G-specific adenine glycosylase [Bacteroidales bacterium]